MSTDDEGDEHVDAVEAQVQQALQHQIRMTSPPPPLPQTTNEGESTSEESETPVPACGCKLSNGKSCSGSLNLQAVEAMRSEIQQLTHDELDMVILAQIAASYSTETTKTCFHFNGLRICQTIFLFLHHVSRKRLRALLQHYKTAGLTPRVHGNTKRLPPNTTPFATIEEVLRFILTLAEEQALVLPGRIPGYHRSDIQLLPSNTTKLGVWSKYCESCTSTRRNPISRKTFCTIWQQLVPQVVIMKPMTDLCWQCQQNNSLVLRAGSNIKDKSEALQKALKHIHQVEREQTFYNNINAKCRDVTRSAFNQQGTFHPPPPASRAPPLTGPSQAHYSFDYAQQVHYPSDPMQPGPIYFLTPRKCSLFGICCEAIPRQVNYLCDESVDRGKGANTVVSQLHHFFANHGLGEEHLYLHADNCTGQNKNNTMMSYLAWRVMTGLHSSITLSFLVAGHTKFSPDWCFGLIKQLYRKTRVDCLDDIVEVVNKSANCNVAQLVGTQQGDVLVPVYDWTAFLDAHFGI